MIAIAVLIAWIPICALLFAVMAPVRACTFSFVVGWLLLPMAELELQGFPDIDKVLATSIGAGLGTMLFCPRQFAGLRIHTADVFLLLFAAATGITSLTNDLGGYDGAASCVHKILYYGVPFLFGRAFLKTKHDLWEAACGVVLAAALYGVLALWEWRMSPQFHNLCYGFFPHSWMLGLRWGFFRPILFFPSTLALGSFFGWTALLGVWLYRAGRLPSMAGLPPAWIAVLPAIGLLTSMSFGPWALFLVGWGLLVVWKKLHKRHVVLLPTLFALVWMAGRYTSWTDGEWLTASFAKLSENRASSLQYRIDAETMYLNKTRQRPYFGWGGFGRNRPTNDKGKDLAASDGLWIIYISEYGLIGLCLFFMWWTWPTWMSVVAGRGLEEDAVLMAVIVIGGLQAVNFLFNAFLDPILTMMCGGAVTQLVRLRARRGCVPRKSFAPARKMPQPVPGLS